MNHPNENEAKMEWLSPIKMWVSTTWSALTKLFQHKLNLKIAELEMANYDLKKQLAQTEEVLRAKDAQLNLKNNLVWKYPVFRVEGESQDDAYCPHCWESDQKQIHLRKWNQRDWYCQTCERVFET